MHQSSVESTNTYAVVGLSILTLLASESIYKYAVFDTKYYQEVDTQYKQLLSRQQVLEKKQRDSKKTDIGMSEKEQQEYQSNISALTGLKRSIKKQRHPAQLATALMTFVMMRIISSVFDGVPVAVLPFQPFKILEHFIGYGLQSDNEKSLQYVSAPFLFFLVFAAFKVVIRRSIQETTRLQQRMIGVSIPRSMLMKQNGIAQMWNSSETKTEFLMNFLGHILGTWYSLYSIYKALKKYKSFKYVISATRIISRFTGFCCSVYVPYPIRYLMYGGFAKFYGIDMSEVVHEDFGHYTTFTKFFTRHLKDGARTFADKKNPKSMCSPCDGCVLTCGQINSQYSTIDCVKGRSYRLDEFMLGQIGENLVKDKTKDIPNNSGVAAMLDKVQKRGNQLMYMVIYLSPADYHRFHSPAVHTGDFRRHIVGYLSPVKPSHVNVHKDVFKNNERVNIFGRWAQGFYFESAVGATNVGSIKLDFDEEVITNKTLPQYPYYEDKNYLSQVSAEKAGPFYEYLKQSDFEKDLTNSSQNESKSFTKGEMTGRFEMGSTIVLIFEADSKTSLAIHEGQKLKLGEPIVNHN